jgi:DNA-directed RNA polymerase subunit omega
MLVKPTMEDLLKKVKSRYTLTILTAKRARQLVNGALPLAPSDTPNYVTTACEEIHSGRVIPVKGIVEVYIPLRPEILAERLAAKAAQENERLQQAIEDTINRNALAFDTGNDEDESDLIDEKEEKEDGQGNGESVPKGNAFEELVVVNEISEPQEPVASETAQEPVASETAQEPEQPKESDKSEEG